MKQLALILLLPLSACVSDEKAVDMGLATACDGKGVVSSLGDAANRYVTVAGGESCKGPKRNTYDTRTLAVLDCTFPARLDVKVSLLAVDTAKHGASYDHSQIVDTQKARLRLGLTDLAGAQTRPDRRRGSGNFDARCRGRGMHEAERLSSAFNG